MSSPFSLKPNPKPTVKQNGDKKKSRPTYFVSHPSPEYSFLVWQSLKKKKKNGEQKQKPKQEAKALFCDLPCFSGVDFHSLLQIKIYLKT